MSVLLFPQYIRDNYEIEEYRNGISVLRHAFPNEWNDLVDLLSAFVLRRSEVIAPGGRKSTVADQLDSFLYARGWGETEFKPSIHLDEYELIKSAIGN